MVVVGGHMQGGKSILALDVWVSSFLKQQTGDLDLAILGRNVQWSETFLLSQT